MEAALNLHQVPYLDALRQDGYVGVRVAGERCNLVAGTSCVIDDIRFAGGQLSIKI